MKVQSQHIKDAAKDQNCTLTIPGVCRHRSDTVVLCHYPDESGTGIMAGKSSDLCAGFGCHECHSEIDRKTNISKLCDEDREFFMRRSMLITHGILVELGIFVIKGFKNG
jgi:putative nuclease YbcO-like protein